MNGWCLSLTKRLIYGLTLVLASPSWVWAQAAEADTSSDAISNTQRGFVWALVLFFVAIIVAIISKSANRDERPKKIGTP